MKGVQIWVVTGKVVISGQILDLLGRLSQQDLMKAWLSIGCRRNNAVNKESGVWFENQTRCHFTWDWKDSEGKGLQRPGEIPSLDLQRYLLDTPVESLNWQMYRKLWSSREEARMEIQIWKLSTQKWYFALRIPGTGEPGGLLSVGSHRVGHDWSDLAAAAADGI